MTDGERIRIVTFQAKLWCSIVGEFKVWIGSLDRNVG